MQTIDFVCEDDLTPRARSLADSLQRLGVPLAVQQQLPAQPSRPVLLLPRSRDSQWHKGETRNLWSVAIYLDNQAQEIPATHQFALPKWPARSCDPLLEKLASYLKRPEQVQFPHTGSAASQTSSSDADSRQERRVMAGFAILAIAFVVWLANSDSSGSLATEEAAEAMVEQTTESSASHSPPATASHSTPIARADAKDNASARQQADDRNLRAGSLAETGTQAAETDQETVDLEALFQRQLLNHPEQCLITRSLQSPPQEITASTTTTTPAAHWPPASR